MEFDFVRFLIGLFVGGVIGTLLTNLAFYKGWWPFNGPEWR